LNFHHKIQPFIIKIRSASGSKAPDPYIGSISVMATDVAVIDDECRPNVRDVAIYRFSLDLNIRVGLIKSWGNKFVSACWY